MPNPSVLIVGAGPAGLNLALRLARHGIAFRIVDAHDGPAKESRALVVQARTLEFYRQLGFADAVVAAGTRIEGVRLHEGGRERAHVVIEDIGEGLSRYPFILDFPQDEHERFLVDRLREAGVEVERSTSLRSFEQDDDGVDTVLTGPDGRDEQARFAYICGCDGARSTVRGCLGIGFGGGTYQHRYYVADVRLETPDRHHELHLATGPQAFALRLPARQGEMERLIGFVPDEVQEPTFDDVRELAERLLETRVTELNWFSTYRVHHRVADRFRQDRAFLLGDAGHLHSPVGGQGMNTGIGDAVNLSWKLAHVLQGRASSTLLDTYEPERIAFARELVATTDRLFRMVTAEGLAGQLFRTLVMPTVAPVATHWGSARRALFRTVSQIHIDFPDSALSEGKAGDVRGGDRLPWVGFLDNFAPLSSLDWQLHIYGEPGPELVAAASALSLPLQVFPTDEQVRRLGLEPGAAYLVRPDGHVALAMARPEATQLEAYVRRHGLSFR